VELVVYPPTRSFYELLSEQLSGNGAQSALGTMLAGYFSKGEVEMLRAMRPLSIFRSGEPLALLPFTLLR